MLIETLNEGNSWTPVLIGLAVLRILLEVLPVLRPLRLKMDEVTLASPSLHRWGLLLAIAYLFTIPFTYAQTSGMIKPPTQKMRPPKIKDDFGWWQRSRSYKLFEAQSNIHVFTLHSSQSFITTWSPDSSVPKKVMFLLHGTGGTAYDALKDQFKLAKEFGVGLVALQWFIRPPQTYIRPNELFPLLDEAIKIVGMQLGWPTQNLTIHGFSRGSASLLEVAKANNQAGRPFTSFIMVSGGAPTNAVIAKGESTQVDPFLEAFNKRSHDKAMYAGLRFWLYSGEKDEEWGPTMSLYMKNAKEGIEAFGGHVQQWVNDPQGSHMGPLKNESLQRQYFEFFVNS